MKFFFSCSLAATISIAACLQVAGAQSTEAIGQSTTEQQPPSDAIAVEPGADVPAENMATPNTNPPITALRVTVTHGTQPAPVEAPLITVRRAGALGGQPMTLSENPGTIELEPGNYEVTVRTSAESETAPRMVSVAPNQTTELQINLAEGMLVLNLTAAGKPLARAPLVQFRCGQRILESSSTLPAGFRAIAGVYQARLQLMSGQFHDIPDLEIKAGETNNCTIEVPCAQVTVTVNGGNYAGEGARKPYVEVDRNSRLITALTANPAKFHLLCGSYEVFVREDDRRIGLQRFTLEPGQELDVTIDAARP